MVEDNLCRECGSELNPKLKYCPNCKCTVGIEKIDETPQKVRSQNTFQKFTENIVWGIFYFIL